MYNKVILVGNLTRDPEMRYTPSGTGVCTFGFAVNNRRSEDEVLFVDIVTFDKQAESCAQYLNKGRQALVEGRLKYRTWENQDGQKRSKHEVLADSVQFMGTRGDAPDSNGVAVPAGRPGDEPVKTAVNEFGDDIPF